MTGLLKTFRNNLRPEHRLTRMLLSGASEIILVMVGILLALQVNNWNDDRKRDQLERKVLDELVQNLRMDSADHAGNREWSLRIAASAGHIVDELEARRPWHDSMAVHYGWLIPHGLATLNTSAYDNLKSIGFNLIRNDSVRIALTAYHSVELVRLLAVEREFGSESMIHHIVPAVLKRVRINKPWGDSTPRDHAALLDDHEFQSVVRWKSVALGHMANEYGTAQRKATALITMIEREIERRW